MTVLEPAPVLDALARATTDAPVALLLRHAERAVLAGGAGEYYLPITSEGVAKSRALGLAISGHLIAIHTSPLTRCAQTAEAIGEGAGISLNIEHDRFLGDPGVFVVDDQLAGEQWARLGNDAMMDAMTSSAPPLPGLAPYREAARRMLDHVREVVGARPGVHVFVTHDSVLAGFVAQLTPTSR